MNISDSQRRRAFSMRLRTGSLPPLQNADGIEFKFNPWHDPESGRFTFIGAGRHYGEWGGGAFAGGGGGKGGGATGSGDWQSRSSRPKPQVAASRTTLKRPMPTTSPDNVTVDASEKA